MSGWQTRVFERENPYDLNYRENISRVKTEFLYILDSVANGTVKSSYVLSEFFRLELIEKSKREASLEWLAKHLADQRISILQIVEALEQHFLLPRSARLPVLGIQAIYMTMMSHIARYQGMSLSPLSEHSAADENTGAVGDVEVIDADGDVFEGVEVKHGVVIDDNIVRRACAKVNVSTASRYYILSTSPRINLSELGKTLITDLQKKHGCQMVVNGVVPTIKYYLRLLDEPAEFLTNYQKLLITDRRITRDQTDAWREIARGFDLS
jgi:DNA (cytosine-5)-methyltransferase 1